MMDILNCCDICGEGHSTELCPELGLNIVQIELDQLSTRARLTLPGYVQMVDNGSGLVGVVAKETIPKKTQLGPFEAKRTTHIFDDTGFFTLKLIAKDGTTVCLDTTDENECNWLCLVRAACSDDEKNCIAYQLGNNIFYNTTRDILASEELLVWYAPHFARKLGKPSEPDGETRVLLGHRIEPLTTDLLLDTDSESPVYQTDGIDEAAGQSAVHITEGARSSNTDKPTGEIRKAFYCPRCGNTFESQTKMVQHLREHVIASGDTPRRGRGRPRKIVDPASERVSHTHGRGRPRKTAVVENGKELGFKKTAKTYSRKRKFEPDESDMEFDDGDDEDDFADKIEEEDLIEANNDSEYSPNVDISVSVTRVQPRRSTRGKHSKFDEDYVYSSIKKEVKEKNEPGTVMEENVSAKSDIAGKKTTLSSNSVATNGQVGTKRGRGRPRKIKTEETDETDESYNTKKDLLGTLSAETVKESLMALKEGDKTDSGKESKPVFDNSKDLSSANISENVTTETGMLELDDELQRNEVDVNHDTVENSEVKVSDKINEFEVIGENNEITFANSEECEESNLISQEEEGTAVENSNQEDTGTEQNEVKVHNEQAEVQLANDLVEKEDKGSVVVMFEETDDGSYGCAICDDKFTNELDAISHFMNHDTKGTSTCKTCLETFHSLEDLLEHRKICIPNVPQTPPTESIADQENVQAVQYECDICKQAFKTAQYLYRHMVIHTDVFQCEKCGKTFSRKDSLQKHVLKCCPEYAEKYKIFYCDVCLRVFSKESGLKRHKEKCKSVQCGQCMKIFTSQLELSIHKCKNLDMDDSARYSCGRCSKAFQSLYYLKQHQELHDSHIACDRCGKNFASKDELESHKGLCSTLEGIRLYGSGKCNVCFEGFSNSKIFRNHFLSHTHPYQCDKCEKRFLRIGTLNSHDCEIIVDAVCNICNKTFKNQMNLEKHIKENGCMKYQCSACNEQFRSKAMAKNHSCIIDRTDDSQAEIISISNTREVCPTCGKSFSTKSNLTKHMLLHGEKKYGCPHCPKFFHLDVYLKEHITCVHYKIFKYQCNVCGRLLKSKTGLIAHTRIFHAKNAEVFPCTKCGKVFKQKGNLRSHMYSHSKTRNFKCDMCTKAFKFPDQLSRHKLEHKLADRLKCIHCAKEFFRPYDLKKHLQVYHSGYIYVCGICSARCGHRHTLIRHYKRKHPENLSLTTQEGYVDSLLKHYSQLYDSKNYTQLYEPAEQSDSVATKCIVLGDKAADTDEGLQDTDVAQVLPEDAAEALRSLALGHVTTKQIQILKEKGLFLQNDGNLIQNQGHLIQDQGQVIIPQDSYLFEGQSVEQQSTLEVNAVTSSAASIEGTVGMIQNSDGTISLNGLTGIPQTIEGLATGDGHVVILQIVDPEAQDQPGEIVQINPVQQSEIIQLSEEQQEKLMQLNANHQGQVIQLSQDHQGQVISLNQNMYEDSGVYQGEDTNSQIHTVVVDNVENVDQELPNETGEQEMSQNYDDTESDVGQNEAVKLETIPVISIEGGDPNIQAPMVYSQDVTCSDEIE